MQKTATRSARKSSPKPSTKPRRAAPKPAPRVGLVSLGCPKALVDSERIITKLRSEGYQLSAEYAGADVVVINTCGFLNSAKQAVRMEKVGAIVMLAAPIVMALAKAPHILVIEVFAGVMILAMTVLMHATTLPVEFDASFRRALPVLKAGGYISDADMPAARKILKAAAYTYVAAAAMSLLDVARWIRVLRI